MAVERFYIVKEGTRDGPYDESYVRFLLENEEVGFDDYCETEDGERFRLGTLYEAVDEDEEEEEEAGDDEQAGDEEDGGSPKRSPRPSRLIYSGHPSFLRYPISWLLVIGGAVGGTLLGQYYLWAMLAGYGLASLAIFYMVIGRAAHQYIITGKRIEAIRGLVAKDSKEIRVEDIRTINVIRSGIPGLLGVGTVEFSSTGDAVDVEFADVWAARRVKKLVRRLQDELEEG